MVPERVVGWRPLLNFVKHNRRLYQAGQLKEERIEAFKRLLAMMEQYKRKNQWE